MKTSLWTRHVQRWQSCKACSLCTNRKTVVLARGQVPAEIVFCGEAPGRSEDVLGQPFKGPAGHLLDAILNNALEDQVLLDADGNPQRPRIAFSNLVCCLPVLNGDKMEPDNAAIKACRPRLVEFVRMCRPRLVVLVGKLAQKHVDARTFEPVNWLPLGESLRFAEVDHPAFILRMPDAQKGIAIQRCEVKIRKAFEDMVNGTGGSLAEVPF